MKASRRELIVALSLCPGIGGKTVTRILTRNDLLGRTNEEFLRLGAEAIIEEYRFNRKTADIWSANKRKQIEEAQALLKKLDAFPIEVVTSADANYPRNIEALDPDPPGVLFFYGNVRLLRSNTFCVLSSRGSSESELAQIESCVEEGVLNGEVLVSGHDTPEYQRSAVVPLRWGAPRVLVLDQGFFHVFGPDLTEEPFRAARLWRYKFDAKTDLAVTWVSPERGYHTNSNRLRDRLVVSLSSRLDCVRVSPGGNMERLAKLALKAGRAVRVSPTADQFTALAALGAGPLVNERR